MKSSFLFVCLASAWVVSLPAASLQIDSSLSNLHANVTASPSHSFEAQVENYDAVIKMTPDGKVESAEVSFLFEEVDTDNKSRDKKMRKWMDVTEHPEVTFALSEVVIRDGSTVGLGELTMHGVTKAVEIPFTLKIEDAHVVLEGEVALDTHEWDLKTIRILFFSVNPELQVVFHLEGTVSG